MAEVAGAAVVEVEALVVREAAQVAARRLSNRSIPSEKITMLKQKPIMITPLLVTFILILAVISCNNDSDNDNTGGNPDGNSVSGTYTAAFNPGLSLTINSDGSYAYTSNEIVYSSGTYRISDNNLVMNNSKVLNAGSSNTLWRYSVSGQVDELWFKDNDNSVYTVSAGTYKCFQSVPGDLTINSDGTCTFSTTSSTFTYTITGRWLTIAGMSVYSTFAIINSGFICDETTNQGWAIIE
jgi:hypothetical protein